MRAEAFLVLALSLAAAAGARAAGDDSQVQDESQPTDEDVIYKKKVIKDGGVKDSLPEGEEAGEPGAGDSGSGATAGPGGARPRASAPPPQRQSADPQIGRQGSRAMEGASRLGDALRSALPQAGAGDIGGAAGRSGSGARSSPALRQAAAALAPGAAGGPASPVAVGDLVLASRTGFSGVFKDMGLKVGPGPAGDMEVQRRDGSPASPAEVAALAQRIRSEPEALMGRPDFFEVLSRKKYQQVKDGLAAASPEARGDYFRHIELSAEARDLRWSASCNKLSGECNQYTRLERYSKNSYVPPEDLKNIWGALQEEIARGASAQAQPQPGTASSLPPAATRSIFADGVSGIMDRIRSVLAGGRGASQDSGAVVAGPPGQGPSAAPGALPAKGLRSGSVPGPGQGRPSSRWPLVRLWLFRAAALAAAVLIALRFSRRLWPGTRPGL